MATIALPLSTHANRPLLYVKEIKYEFIKMLRRRSFSLATIGFPVMFYLIFGVANRHASAGSVSIAKYLLGGYACFGVVGSSLFGIGVGLAMERSVGWLDLKRSSPMPPLAYLLAKCVTAMAFGVIIASILMVLSVVLAGVSLSFLEVVKVLACVAAGAIPFASMGLLLALVIPASATPGVVNLIYLPMSFCSGLWMPISSLPVWLQHVAPALPTYHLAQLMLSIFGYAETGAIWTHCIMLFGFTLLMLGMSWLIFQRAEQKA